MYILFGSLSFRVRYIGRKIAKNKASIPIGIRIANNCDIEHNFFFLKIHLINKFCLS